jgi:hypothetical protein
MAIASLVLGIVALPSVCCYGVPAVAFGVTALILGRVSLGNIRASGGVLAGEGLAQAGWITGVVGGSLGLLYILGLVGFFMLTVFLASSPVLPSPTP